MFAIFWVIWMEFNMSTFDDYKGVGAEDIWGMHFGCWFLQILGDSFFMYFLDLQAQFGSLMMTCLICKGGSVAYILVFLTFLYS